MPGGNIHKKQQNQKTRNRLFRQRSDKKCITDIEQHQAIQPQHGFINQLAVELSRGQEGFHEKHQQEGQYDGLIDQIPRLIITGIGMHLKIGGDSLHKRLLSKITAPFLLNVFRHQLA